MGHAGQLPPANPSAPSSPDAHAGLQTEELAEVNRWIARYWVVVEHAIAQLSRFAVLRPVCRGDYAGHSRASRAVAALVDRRIGAVTTDLGPLGLLPDGLAMIYSSHG